ncbi:Girdin, putative [Ixodes scapularis]|uniref:Girdin, putative n=1 Tax=Ixodes scapularis TaxID=6945 RepID=B7Q677_IXOSC|nr:Girdin, putative [Ixodes scapularis]|eukprot:XP_002411925.1 Girdin, putative [Ixodes scapularis]
MTARLRNLNMLVHNIKVFYEEVLEQVLVMHLPNVVSIAKGTYDGESCQELSRLLLLMLGCAVQCGRKGRFIEAIRRLDLATQASLAEAIASVTDNPEAVWTRDWGRLEALPDCDRARMYTTLVRHVAALARQRDAAAQRLVNLTLEQESCGTSASDVTGDQLSSGGGEGAPYQAVDSRLGVELADAKAKLRRCQQELEEKLEVASEQKEELHQLKEAIARLRQENLELVQDARTAKAYRDEIDILKEKVLKLDRLESEIQRYKDKMSELEFFRSRVEELREDKRILGETKAMLEEQLEGSRRRAEHALQLEAQLLKTRARLSECTLERDLDRSQVQKLLEQNSQLRLDHQASLEESAQLQSELQRLRSQAASPRTENSLLEQLNTDAETRVLQLELENRRLQVSLDELRAKVSTELLIVPAADRTLTLFHCLQVEESPTKEDLQAQCAVANERLERLEEKRAALEQQYEAQLRRAAELESANTELERQLDSCKGDSARLEELEKTVQSSSLESQRLQRALDASQGRLSECRAELQASEAESAKLQSTLESLRGQLQRLHSLELEGADLEAWLHRAEQERKGLERESARLRVALQAKDVSLDELSSRVSLLERENEQLRKDAQAQAPTAARARELEQLCQELTQKGSLDSKALTDLRQELVEEKLRSDQLTGELERIASSLELTTSLWKSERESSRETQMPSRDTGFLPLLCLEKTKAVLDEIENLSAVSAEEKRSKADREALLPKSTELIECMPEAPEGVDRDKLISRKVLELKDNILTLEKKNGVFEEENWRLRSQLQALQEHTASLQGRATSGEQRRLSLQSQHAQLQVEAACLGSQHAALQQSASQLQERLGRVEAQKDQLSSEKSELEHSREALVRDHQVLEKLHEQLSADYQALASNLSCVKASCKLLKQENTALKEQLEEATLAGEVLRLAHDDPQGTNLRAENAKLKLVRSSVYAKRCMSLRVSHQQEEASALRQAEERTRAELDSLRAQHRALKDSHSSLRMDHSRLRGDLEESRGDLATARLDLSRLVASYEVLSQAQGTMQEERQRLLSGLSSLLRLYRGRLPEPSSSPGFQEECLLLRDLEAARDDLESCLRDYARKLDGSLSLCKEPLARARLSHLTCNVTEMEEVLGVSLAGIGNGLCARGRFPTDFGDLNGRPWGALSQDDQIPVRDVGPLSQPCPVTPALEGSKLPESLVFRDPPPTCSTPLGTPKQRQSPPPRPHVTVENHTTVNLVTHLNTTEPAVPSSSGFSRSPAARHSMYSRLRTGVANSPGLRAPLQFGEAV